MYSIARTLGVFTFAGIGFLATVSGCDEVTEAIDCDQLCDRMQLCLDGDIDVRDCAERCEDKVDDKPLADKLDACTDCLESDPSCKETVDECPICDEVQMALLP